tara:strand:- start:1254 stop:1781 length:528 start_codon:yes stop_codon:yes gene_type:complete
MAIKTMSHNSGGGLWSEGWHQLTIESAEYGDWNGVRFLDTRFEGYPNTFKLRVYEANNKETHEEFALAKFFKLSNAGIIDKVKSPNGKEVIQYDDNPSGLVGKKINGYFYKEGEYVRVSDRIAPVAQEGTVISYSEDDVHFWKGVTEKHIAQRKQNAPAVADTAVGNASEANMPF